MPTGSKPGRGTGCDPSVEGQTIAAAVERYAGFVLPGFMGHHADRFRGNVRSIDRQKPDPAFEPRRQGLVQVSLMHQPSSQADVSEGALYRCRINVRCMEFDPVNPIGKSSPHGAGTATKIHHNGWRGAAVAGAVRAQQRSRLVDEQFGAATRNKNPRVQGNAESAEL